MKKNIIIPLLLLLLSGNFIQAQDFVKQSENSVVYSNIIKSCPLYPYSVVCYSRDANSGYIELRTEGSTTRRVPVPLEYNVKDLKVFNNLVYFCGQHINQGFVGIVNLYHLVNPSVIYTNAGASYIDLGAADVSDLEKLVVYNDNASPQNTLTADEDVVAIGKGGYQSRINGWIVVHLKYNNHHLFNGNKTEASNVTIDIVYDFIGEANDDIQQLLLTDDYVVLVGHNPAFEHYLIHFYDKNNISSSNHPVYKFDYPPYEVLSDIKSVSLEGNNIALATLALKDIEQHTFEIRIRNIHVSPLNMFMNNSQALPLGEQKRDVEMAYNSDQHKLVLMLGYDVYNTSYFFEINPWALATSTSDAIYESNHQDYAAIDHANGPYYVAVYKNIWFRKKLPNNNVASSSCYGKFNTEVTLIDNLDGKDFEPTSIQDRFFINTLGRVVDIEFITKNSECTEE